MLEVPDKLGYAIWDNKDFIIPKEFDLNENSKIQDALRVFYSRIQSYQREQSARQSERITQRKDRGAR